MRTRELILQPSILLLILSGGVYSSFLPKDVSTDIFESLFHYNYSTKILGGLTVDLHTSDLSFHTKSTISDASVEIHESDTEKSDRESKEECSFEAKQMEESDEILIRQIASCKHSLRKVRKGKLDDVAQYLTNVRIAIGCALSALKRVEFDQSILTSVTSLIQCILTAVDNFSDDHTKLKHNGNLETLPTSKTVANDTKNLISIKFDPSLNLTMKTLLELALLLSEASILSTAAAPHLTRFTNKFQNFMSLSEKKLKSINLTKSIKGKISQQAFKSLRADVENAFDIVQSDCHPFLIQRILPTMPLSHLQLVEVASKTVQIILNLLCDHVVNSSWDQITKKLFSKSTDVSTIFLVHDQLHESIPSDEPTLCFQKCFKVLLSLSRVLKLFPTQSIQKSTEIYTRTLDQAIAIIRMHKEQCIVDEIPMSPSKMIAEIKLQVLENFGRSMDFELALNIVYHIYLAAVQALWSTLHTPGQVEFSINDLSIRIALQCLMLSPIISQESDYEMKNSFELFFELVWNEFACGTLNFISTILPKVCLCNKILTDFAESKASSPSFDSLKLELDEIVKFVVSEVPIVSSQDDVESNQDGLDETESNQDGLDETESNHDGLDETESNHDGLDETESNHDGLDETESNHDGLDETESNHDGLDETESNQHGLDETETQYPHDADSKITNLNGTINVDQSTEQTEFEEEKSSITNTSPKSESSPLTESQSPLPHAMSPREEILDAFDDPNFKSENLNKINLPLNAESGNIDTTFVEKAESFSSVGVKSSSFSQKVESCLSHDLLTEEHDSPNLYLIDKDRKQASETKEAHEFVGCDSIQLLTEIGTNSIASAETLNEKVPRKKKGTKKKGLAHDIDESTLLTINQKISFLSALEHIDTVRKEINELKSFNNKKSQNSAWNLASAFTRAYQTIKTETIIPLNDFWSLLKDISITTSSLSICECFEQISELLNTVKIHIEQCPLSKIKLTLYFLIQLFTIATDDSLVGKQLNGTELAKKLESKKIVPILKKILFLSYAAVYASNSFSLPKTDCITNEFLIELKKRKNKDLHMHLTLITNAAIKFSKSAIEAVISKKYLLAKPFVPFDEIKNSDKLFTGKFTLVCGVNKKCGEPEYKYIASESDLESGSKKSPKFENSHSSVEQCQSDVSPNEKHEIKLVINSNDFFFDAEKLQIEVKKDAKSDELSCYQLKSSVSMDDQVLRDSHQHPINTQFNLECTRIEFDRIKSEFKTNGKLKLDTCIVMISEILAHYQMDHPCHVEQMIIAAMNVAKVGSMAKSLFQMDVGNPICLKVETFQSFVQNSTPKALLLNYLGFFNESLGNLDKFLKSIESFSATEIGTVLERESILNHRYLLFSSRVFLTAAMSIGVYSLETGNHEILDSMVREINFLLRLPIEYNFLGAILILFIEKSIEMIDKAFDLSLIMVQNLPPELSNDAELEEASEIESKFYSENDTFTNCELVFADEVDSPCQVPYVDDISPTNEAASSADKGYPLDELMRGDKGSSTIEVQRIKGIVNFDSGDEQNLKLKSNSDPDTTTLECGQAGSIFTILKEIDLQEKLLNDLDSTPFSLSNGDSIIDSVERIYQSIFFLHKISQEKEKNTKSIFDSVSDSLEKELVNLPKLLNFDEIIQTKVRLIIKDIDHILGTSKLCNPDRMQTILWLLKKRFVDNADLKKQLIIHLILNFLPVIAVDFSKVSKKIFFESGKAVKNGNQDERSLSTDSDMIWRSVINIGVKVLAISFICDFYETKEFDEKELEKITKRFEVIYKLSVSDQGGTLGSLETALKYLLKSTLETSGRVILITNCQFNKKLDNGE